MDCQGTCRAAYEAAVEDLYARHRSVRDAGFSGDAYKPGLDAMRSYAAFLGNPERRFRSIHVAGTNGKGSVCSMLAAALASRGLRVGLYTSPHLVDFRERIKIIELPPEEGGHPEELPLRSIPPTQAWAPPVSARRPFPLWSPKGLFPFGVATGGHGSPDVPPLPAARHYLEIDEEAVCRFMREYDREGLTFFEVTTGMAFWWFAEEKVDVAVIETGLGGRLDSTNIITPELAVITSIGLDHCDLLGSTRAEIAGEKAGIFKHGVPALVWGRDPETQPVFESAAARTGSPLFFAEDFQLPGEGGHSGNHGRPWPPRREDVPWGTTGGRIVSQRREGPAGCWVDGTELAPERTDNRLWEGCSEAEVLPSVPHHPAAPLNLQLDLIGPCQGINLRTTLAALATFFERESQVFDNQSIAQLSLPENRQGQMAKELKNSELKNTPNPAPAGSAGIDDATLAAIASAAGITGFRGRWERLLAEPLTICDIGHNPPALAATFARLEQLRSEEPDKRRPLLVVYGAMKDKDVDTISTLFPADAEYFLVQPDTPRAMPLQDLALKLKHLNAVPSGSVANGVKQALERSAHLPGAIVYIGGSTFVVSEAITYLERV